MSDEVLNYYWLKPALPELSERTTSALSDERGQSLRLAKLIAERENKYKQLMKHLHAHVRAYAFALRWGYNRRRQDILAQYSAEIYPDCLNDMGAALQTEIQEAFGLKKGQFSILFPIQKGIEDGILLFENNRRLPGQKPGRPFDPSQILRSPIPLHNERYAVTCEKDLVLIPGLQPIRLRYELPDNFDIQKAWVLFSKKDWVLVVGSKYYTRYLKGHSGLQITPDVTLPTCRLQTIKAEELKQVEVDVVPNLVLSNFLEKSIEAYLTARQFAWDDLCYVKKNRSHQAKTVSGAADRFMFRRPDFIRNYGIAYTTILHGLEDGVDAYKDTCVVPKCSPSKKCEKGCKLKKTFCGNKPLVQPSVEEFNDFVRLVKGRPLLIKQTSNRFRLRDVSEVEINLLFQGGTKIAQIYAKKNHRGIRLKILYVGPDPIPDMKPDTFVPQRIEDLF